MGYLRAEHQAIADVLSSMNHDVLRSAECWFGGGTAIVLRFGEYRRSLDLDFLCSSAAGYRDLRNAVIEGGPGALFSDEVSLLRDVRADAYGIRMLLEYRGQPIKFEIVRETRIALTGERDPILGVPTLSIEDMFAEKLLANADRCYDRAVGYRDAVDLGVLVQFRGSLPEVAVAKSEEAYGRDIARKLAGILNHLLNPDAVRHAASTLDMGEDAVISAVSALRSAGVQTFPQAGIRADGSAFD
ncbi:nucleotidyl transferase AbiEii/AbiGii toxin family protein [Rhizobium sp. DKSPLA3]|uniref:Nucleotidyl transferase AbiEii/AbiGii toxin family protein n=1 Tax=Rhizobium quercicola TaxID=2901226 RepID=A0A9X1T1R8_9HYPH|nr:nucleotidyl transferase AbiEii/AbiGii toxin family protein [Rhizobium quercicola]MCD7110966.1 nucleotidyl transferase AbiEii/AbiGii toxin family protein [Rhizobium quercicola]